MKFLVVNLGCKVNRIESDTISAELSEHGCVEGDDADVVVINTCTVTGEAEKKARKATRRALRENPSARVLVTGCAASINPDEFTSIDPRVRVVGKSSVVASALRNGSQGTDVQELATTPRSARNSSTLSEEELATAKDRSAQGYRTRVGIKIQDGCNNACTFCIVHVARGKARSRDVDSCVDEAVRLEQAGVREAVLSGIDIGNYHSQKDARDIDLCDLLQLIREAAPRMRLRISSCEPAGVTDKLLHFIASEDGMVCRHLHIPLQSGSSRVLAQMNRPYTAQDYVALVRKVREIVPKMSISTDIIVGFPGETDEDFAQTMEVARACQFSKIHVFRYSKRKGTPAAVRTDQIPDKVKAQRAHDLSKLGWILRLEDAQARIGDSERVVALENGIGMSESYHDVHVGNDILPGKMKTYTFTGVAKDGIFTV